MAVDISALDNVPGPLDHIDHSCKGVCGFYGSTIWKGYCSICYYNYYRRDCGHSEISLSSHMSDVSTTLLTESHTTQPLLEKELETEMFKNSSSSRVPVKNPVAREHSKMASPTAMDTAEPIPRLVGAELASYLATLNPILAKDIRLVVTSAVKKFKEMVSSQLSAEKWSEMVQEFYEHTHLRFTRDCQQTTGCPPLSEQSVRTLMDYIERFVMRRIYSAVFCPPSTTDDADDVSLLNKMRSLRWVTVHQLEAGLIEGDSEVRMALDAARSDLLHMTDAKSPVEKLEFVMSCSRHVFEALRKSCIVSGGTAERPASADDFMPALIYVVIRSCVPHLQSNLNYIARFANLSYLNNGEWGYYFTSLCCVVDFVRQLDAASLRLTAHEFDIYMSGKMTPLVAGGFARSLATEEYTCDGLRLMHENLLLLTELQQRQERVLNTAVNLERSMAAYKGSVQQDVNTLLQNSPPLPSVVTIDCQLSTS